MNKSDKNHYLVQVVSQTNVLVVNALDEEDALNQAERAANYGNRFFSAAVTDKVKSEDLEETRREIADVVSDDPDYDWPQKPETD